MDLLQEELGKRINELEQADAFRQQLDDLVSVELRRFCLGGGVER